MRAVVVHLTERELADRRAKGLDRRDEMWNGVLHMTPAPTVEHQRIADRLVEFLGPLLRASRGSLFSGISVFDVDTNYRIPDLTFVAASRRHVLRPDGVGGEGPDAVIEIRSPEDETYEKLPFYAAVGAREVVVIDRDTKRVELYRLAGQQYVILQPDASGWLRSEAMHVRFRQGTGPAPHLIVEDVEDSARRTEI